MNDKENKKRRKHHKFSYYVVFLTITFVCFGVSLYFSFAKKYVEGITVKSDSAINYKIKLKDNTFYDQNELPEDLNYVASLIDYIDANIGYSLSSSKALDYEYTYSIDAIVSVYGESKDKALIQKNYPLVENKTVSQGDSSNINIDEKVNLDYNEYNKFVANYKTSLLLNNNAELTLVMKINTNVKSNELDASKNIFDEVKMVLPLTEQVISSNKSTTAGNNYVITAEQDDKVIENKFVFGTAIIFAIYFIYILIKAILDTDDVKDAPYKRELKKILNVYDLIIVNIESMIDERNYETILVSNFNELKDVHDNIGNPIMFKEIIKNKKSVFVIIKDNILYKYILNSENN